MVAFRVYADDWSRLAELHPTTGSAAVVRELISAHIKRVEEAINQKVAPAPELDDLEL
jgi:predicted DNA-binding protein